MDDAASMSEHATVVRSRRGPVRLPDDDLVTDQAITLEQWRQANDPR